MGKFRLRVKLQGLEVEIDGEREDLSVITAAVQKQIGGIVEPIEVAANGRKQLSEGAPIIEGEPPATKARLQRRRSSGSKSAESVAPVEFRHDSSLYGNPLQNWSIEEKCIWLLYVLKNLASLHEVQGSQLVATFNQYFKTAGKIHPPNATREMSRAKGRNPAPLGEDKGAWFLTTEGDRQAQNLVASVINPTTV